MHTSVIFFSCACNRAARRGKCHHSTGAFGAAGAAGAFGAFGEAANQCPRCGLASKKCHCSERKSQQSSWSLEKKALIFEENQNYILKLLIFE